MVVPFKEQGQDVLKNDENWRLIFVISIVVEVAVILCMIFIFKRPSLKQTVLFCEDQALVVREI